MVKLTPCLHRSERAEVTFSTDSWDAQNGLTNQRTKLQIVSVRILRPSWPSIVTGR